MQKFLTKTRDHIATTLVITGLRMGGEMFAQMMALILITRFMRNSEIAAVELVEDGVVMHKHPSGDEPVRPITVH